MVGPAIVTKPGSLQPPEPLRPVEIGEKATRNPMLLAINDAVRRYNLLLPTMLNMRARNPNGAPEARAVGYLDDVFLNCIGYILVRAPMSRSERGQGRVMALDALIKQVQVHAEFFGFSFLKADLAQNSDKTSMNYWIERYNQEWMGETVFAEFLAWAEGSDQKGAFAPEIQARKEKLKYFSEMKRARFEVYFEGGLLKYLNKDILNTNGTGSYSKLDGSFIYVCSARTRKLYTAASSAGIIHHSSFLKGEPVIAGGDWIVQAGRLKFINAASGHYRPGSSNIRLFLEIYRGSIDQNAYVQPQFEGKIYRIADFLRSGDNASPSAQGEAFVDQFNIQLAQSVPQAEPARKVVNAYKT